MKGILWYVTRKLEGIFDGILMEFRMRISEDKNQTQKSMYIPRFLSSGLYGTPRLGNTAIPACSKWSTGSSHLTSPTRARPGFGNQFIFGYEVEVELTRKW